MSMDLTGIKNQNEYYTNHYFSSIFEENASATISAWRTVAKESEKIKTPWAMLRENAKQFYPIHDRYMRSRFDLQTLQNITVLADKYLESLGYPEAKPENISVDDSLMVPVYLEINKPNGAPLLWVILGANADSDMGILESKAVFTDKITSGEATSAVYADMLVDMTNEELATKILFGMNEPPRFIIFVGMNQIALIDRNKWNEKRYLQFELEDIFSRREETTLQAMAVLLHKDSLCPAEGNALLDELDSNSQKHAAGVSQDLKFALRESIELLGNEVLYDMAHRQGIDLNVNPVDAGKLTLECLRYMYRMLFVLFIEARPELGYAPIKAQSYLTGYSLESLRDITDNIRDDIDEVGDGYYLHETLAKLYELIYTGYPKREEDIIKYSSEKSLHDTFVITPLKAHIFDPEYTSLITNAKLRNSVMLRIVDLMSLTRSTGKKNSRRGRISYANLGINQLGAVYEALLSYRGFIAEDDLYEVKRAGDSFNELDVGYFVKEHELDQYTEDERVRYSSGEKAGKLRMYKKGSFIYRLAGREREKSASYYTPEVLTKCLVKYALKELLEGKTADDILNLTICEPAMGSAAFLNEAINQLAEAYIDRKQKELGETISYEKRFTELQKVKMYIADRNVYGVDLNSTAVELAEVSLWLNTIFEGGFVPWFGTQLVNGNSLIGARRQVYRVDNAQAVSKGMRWFELEPERFPFGTARADKGYKSGRKQIYHFLLGDPGMCNYSDKVIKSLEPDNIKEMVKWNKKFNEPITDEDAKTMLRLSAAIDELWEKQIELRKEVDDKTRDSLSIYGHQDNEETSHTTIRQKDKIFSELYKSEHMRNAGPYARLKFAMDYWCSLWFWPIDKADLLPTRSEFLFDMSVILEGTAASVQVSNETKMGQLSLFPTEMEQLVFDFQDTYGMDSIVDIPKLRKENPRLDLAAQIAEQNKFMHWELEFADLFAEHGGFDLIIGNPPWILLGWNEQEALSDNHPEFAIKKLTATQTANKRELALNNETTRCIYFEEFESIYGQRNFLNAIQNYFTLSGMKANLYKCFLPQAWAFGTEKGISAFVHPDGVFDDPKGGVLREQLYPKLRKHFQFTNELKLFAEVDHHMGFSLNVYSKEENANFEVIANLFSVSTIEESFAHTDIEVTVPGIKDTNGSWNVRGHKDRVVCIGKDELKLFAKLFDGSKEWKKARLPIIHAKQFVDVLHRIANQQELLATHEMVACSSQLWNETMAQKDGTMVRNVHFPIGLSDTIYQGPHFGIANPLAKTSRTICVINSDYDCIDLSMVSEDYIQRVNYSPACSLDEYYRRVPITPSGDKLTDCYRIMLRRMLNQSGERTLITAIEPPYTGHVSTVLELDFPIHLIPIVTGMMTSIISDFYIRVTGKADAFFDTLKNLPIPSKYRCEIVVRTLMLNCLTKYYADLWKHSWDDEFKLQSWAKKDFRLKNSKFETLNCNWNWNTPLRSDYERRQALVEIDVLVAMALGISLEQLKTIYHIQFPVLQQYEKDTWYDANGRIVFTTNRSLVGIGYERKMWETEIKDAPAGQKFYRKITDDTMPGGPVERTIEYVAPFDRCDREKDYEAVWKFFEKKYGK